MTPRDLIMRHEGESLKLYRDSRGYWTIGYGRLLDPSLGGGISQDEALYLLDNDIAKARNDCGTYPWFSNLSEARQAAMLDLSFNLGSRLSNFKHFLAAMAVENWGLAADELENSLWYKQVGHRGPEIVNLIKFEEWP